METVLRHPGEAKVITTHGESSITSEYELRISGTGKGLPEHEGVSLRFRRLANRLEWAGGSLGTVAVGEELP